MTEVKLNATHIVVRTPLRSKSLHLVMLVFILIVVHHMRPVIAPTSIYMARMASTVLALSYHAQCTFRPRDLPPDQFTPNAAHPRAQHAHEMKITQNIMVELEVEVDISTARCRQRAAVRPYEARDEASARKGERVRGFRAHLINLDVEGDCRAPGGGRRARP